VRAESYGFDTWAADLRTAAVNIDDQVRKVTSKTLLEIKKDAQKRVRGHAHLPHLAGSFTYDVTVKTGEIVGEVGADINRRQGPIDHIIEDGTVTDAPIPHWRPAADKQIPLWHEFLDQAAQDAIGDGR
jgi:hypothetical protein